MLVCNILILIVLFLIVLLFCLLFEKRIRLQIICPRLQNNFQPWMFFGFCCPLFPFVLTERQNGMYRIFNAGQKSVIYHQG